jgi:hypothetical protein
MDPGNGNVFADVADVRVKYFRAPRYGLTEVLATSVGDGVYEAAIKADWPGAYYVYVAAPSLNAQYNDLSYLTLMARRTTPAGIETGERQ